jgi:hypothetical protein
MAHLGRRFTHRTSIVGPRATAVGTEKVRGEIHIDVDDDALRDEIAEVYRAADREAYRVLTERR